MNSGYSYVRYTCYIYEGFLVELFLRRTNLHRSVIWAYITSFIIFTLPAASLPAPACLCLRQGFQCIFMIWIYRYTCAYLCTPLGIRNTSRWGVLTPLDLDVQISELGAYGLSRMLIRDAQLKCESLADRLRLYPSMSLLVS